MDLMRYERNVSIEKCVLSQEKNIFTLAQNLATEESVLSNIFLLTQRFLLANFPESQIDATATQFSSDIVELRRDWILDDIIMFFKFIRQRQDIAELKTYGGKITAIKLLEFSGFYENERCEIKEQFLTNQKNLKIERANGDEVVNGLFKATFGKELTERMDRTKLDKMNEMQERAIKTNQHHKENEAKLKELKVLLDKGEIDDIELATQYNNFLIR